MDKPKRRILVSSVFITAIFAAVIAYRFYTRPGKGFESRKLNVVLILIDTLRKDHLELYGYSRKTSTNIGKFAHDGFIFENAIAPASYTRASVASIMTSLYPSSHGAVNENGRLQEKLLTIQEILKENGYTTIGFNSNENAGEWCGFAQGFDMFYHPPSTKGYDSTKPIDRLLTPASGMSDEAIKWLKENKENPFFLYLLYVDPHDPYNINEEYRFNDSYTGEFDGSRYMLRELDNIIYNKVSDIPNIEEVKQYIRDLYDGEIAYTDQQVGRLLNYLKESGLYDTTLIIITADHGEGLWEHKIRTHAYELYQHIVNVPLLIRCPRLQGGKQIKDYVSTIDILPTVLEIAGIRPFTLFQGTSLLPLMLGERKKEREILSEGEIFHSDLVTLIKNKWKLIYDRKNNSYEFYNLRKDRKEQKDLAQSKAYFTQRRFRNLTAILHKKLEENRAINDALLRGDGGQGQPIPQEVQEELRALGYIQ